MTTTLGLAVALAAAALLLRGAVQGSLTREVDGTARQGAHQVAALADTNQLPRTVLAGTLTVQVLRPDGQIVAASPTVDRLVPLLSPARAAATARTGSAVLLDGRPFGIPYLMRVVAVPASGGEIVLSGAAYTQVRDSMRTLTGALLVGTPLLLLLLAGVTWLVVGSTLRPISALRRGAQVITATGVTRELPVPEARTAQPDRGHPGAARSGTRPPGAAGLAADRAGRPGRHAAAGQPRRGPAGAGQAG